MLSRQDLLSLRLRSLLLNQNLVTNPAEVAKHFLAVQAQDLPASEWAFGLRSGANLDQIEQAYRDGQVVRSWPMRGTLHAVPAEDLGWLQQITAEKVVAAAGRRRQQLGLELHDIESVRDGVVEVLTGGRTLSRDALLAEVADRGIRVENHWKYHLLHVLALTGTIVFGPIKDGQQLLVLAEEWIEQPRRLGREESLAELAARYVVAHGPATVDDLSWWSGLGKREAAQALALASDRVVQTVGEDGAEYWLSPTISDTAAVSGVALLPAFDEHLLGYRDRTLVLASAHASAVCPGGNGVFKPTVVVDGVCRGTWRPVARGALNKLPLGRPVPIAVTWFDQDQSGDPILLAEAADQYARYLGRDQAYVSIT